MYSFFALPGGWMTSCIHLEKEGLVNWDWFFGEIMETSSVCEKDTERKDRQNISSKTMCTHIIHHQRDNLIFPMP